jgi:hypothetical protein
MAQAPPGRIPVDPERRCLNLNAYLRNSGYHEAAWRLPPTNPASAAIIRA